MVARSWLFVPGDSERKLFKALVSGADAIIVDLEDSVVEGNKADARAIAGKWLAANRRQVVAGQPQARWVRINALDTPHWREDLAAVMRGAPDGIMVPKASGPEGIQPVAAELYELEGRNGLPSSSTKILPLVSETAAAAIGITGYATQPVPRLGGLTWGAEDLAAAIGATRKRQADGGWTDAFRLIRAQTLLTAHARGVPAIDTLHADFGDAAATQRAAEAARADGFSGMLAIHPSQVPIINLAFTPSEAELAEAQAIVGAFAANPDAGTLQLGGRMIDRPHLEQARRLLGLDD